MSKLGRGINVALAGTLACAAMAAISMGRPHQAIAADSAEDDRVTAHAIKDAYDENDAMGHRLLATKLLAELGRRNGEQTLVMFDALLEVAAERNADGLESALISTLSQVLANPRISPEEREGARDRMLEVYRVERDTLPHHYVPVSRPGTPIVHHIRAAHVRTALEMMVIDPGARTLDEAMELGLCTEAGLADVEARFGPQAREEIEALCQTFATGALGGLGSVPGMPEGMSELDCVGEHDETRAERVQRLMRECYESMQESGNPVADTADATATATATATAGGTATDASATDASASSATATNTDTNASATATDTAGSTTGGATLEPVATFDPNDVKYTRFKKNEDGSVEIIYEMNDGSKVRVGANTPYPGGVPHEIFGNMKPGEEKVIVESAVRRNQQGTTTPGSEDGAMSPECMELAMELHEIDPDTFSGDRPPLDPKVNPPPDDPQGLVVEFDCLGDDETAIDASVGCQDEYVQCEFGELPDASCDCQPARGPMPQDVSCMLVMNCLDGSLPDSECRCEGGEVIEFAPTIGGGPGPDPDPVPVLGIMFAMPDVPGEGGYHHPGTGEH